MDSSPFKRRKTSPTTSVPGDAPTTPSRIPVRRLSTQPLSGRPSFASPTKASLSKHHPQLLNRPSSAGTGAQKPKSGQDDGDSFAGVLGAARPSIEGDGTPRQQVFDSTTPRGSAHIRARSDGLSAKPRRMSRSPFKQAPKPFEHHDATDEMQENINPFVKRGGLRRSPVSQPASQTLSGGALQDLQEQNANPFEKRGLRRSPVSSQAVEAAGELLGRRNMEGLVKTVVARPNDVFQDTQRDVLGLDWDMVQKAPDDEDNYTTQSTEPVTVNSFVTKFPLNPRIPESVEPVEEPRQRRARSTSRRSRSASRRRDRSSEVSEDIVQQDVMDLEALPLPSHLERASPPEVPEELTSFIKDDQGRRSRSGSRKSAVEATEPIIVSQEAEGRRSRSSSRRRSQVPEATNPTSIPRQEDGQRSRSSSRRREISEAMESIPLPQKDESRRSRPARVSEPEEPEQPEEPEDPVPRSVSRRVRGASAVAEPIPFPSRSQQDTNLTSNLPQPSRPARAIETTMFGTRAPREEPDLPPTPIQRGIADPVVTTPPTGIHDTPSKRARKRVAKQKSSPLKPRDPSPSRPPTATTQPPKSLERIKRRKSVRFSVPEDPHVAQRKARDDLLEELQQLKADVALANRENERIRLLHESSKSASKAHSNSEQLLDLLQRSIASEPKPKTKVKPASIFKSIESFLPFTSRRNHQPAAAKLSNKPIPSHLPVKVDDPLPYLQIFCPLRYTSTIDLLPSEAISSDTTTSEAEQSTLQRHLIRASDPSGLFSARLSMIVDSATLTIASLDLQKLPVNAEKELGTFIRERCNPDSVLNKDIGVIGWAMGRWVEVSKHRAGFWCAIEQGFSTKEARAKARTKSIRRKRKRAAIEDDEACETMDEEGRQKWTMRQLLPQMGRTAMEIANEEVEIRFEWRIVFDWTGEVESTVSASTRVPKSWQNQDERKSLRKIPDSFDRLVKERGPLSAVRAVVGLLMPE